MTDDELVFYTHPMSRGRVVRWTLEKIGCPYRAEASPPGPPPRAKAIDDALMAERREEAPATGRGRPVRLCRPRKA